MRGLLSIAVYFYALGAQAASSVDLKTAFEAARKHRSEILIKSNSVKIAEYNKKTAVSEVLPKISAIYSSSWQEEAGFTSDRRQTTTRLNAEQSLFRGGSEYFDLKIAGLQVELAKADRRQAELNLYQEVAGVFFDLLSLQREIATLNEQIEILDKRVKYLQGRAQIGRSKPSDVTMARSQRARLGAQASSTRGQFEEMWSHFLWLTGLSPELELKDSLDAAALKVPPGSADSLKNTPLMKGLQLQVLSSELAAKSEVGRFWPSLDLTGNYYLERTGSTNPSDWDVGLVATWEIFSGGGNWAQLKSQGLAAESLKAESQDQLKKLEMNYLAKKAQLEREQETLRELKMAVLLSEKSYQEQEREYRSSLISNLDVLKALDDLLQVKLLLSRQEVQVKKSWAGLMTLSGETP